METFALSSSRLVLNQPTEADIDAITAYCQDPVFEELMSLPWPYSRSHARYFVDNYVPKGWLTGSELTWALRSATTGAFLGVIGLRVPTRDLGFWIGAPHRGAGLMTEAVRTVTDWVFGTEFAGISTLKWECVRGNSASASVARKAGFRFMGEGPAEVSTRDGSLPTAWHAELSATDSHRPKPGWPL